MSITLSIICVIGVFIALFSLSLKSTEMKECKKCHARSNVVYKDGCASCIGDETWNDLERGGIFGK